MGNCWCSSTSDITSPTGEVQVGDLSDAQLLEDAFLFWEMYRDVQTGLYCDYISVRNNSGSKKGINYSIASLGFGLLTSCVLAEVSALGTVDIESKLSKSDMVTRALQALEFAKNKWPRDKGSGFFAHYITHEKHEATGDKSTPEEPVGDTVDTSIFIAGAVFMKNYSQDAQIASLVDDIIASVKWEKAIYPDKGIATLLKNGEMSFYDPDDKRVVEHMTKPFNEYFLVAYLAKTYGNSDELSRFFDRYFYPPTGGAKSNEFPEGGKLEGHQYPKLVKFGDSTFLSDQDGTTNVKAVQSSFVPLFCRFLSKSFQQSVLYKNMVKDYALGDHAFWRDFIDAYGSDKSLQNAVWGCGAGESPDGPLPSGGESTKLCYGVNHMDNNIRNQYETPDSQQGNASMVYSLPIMAGFLIADDDVAVQRLGIKDKLKALYSQGDKVSGVYDIAHVGNKSSIRILWRGSARYTSWKADHATSIDYAPFILGYASLFVGQDFYIRYSA